MTRLLISRVTSMLKDLQNDDKIQKEKRNKNRTIMGVGWIRTNVSQLKGTAGSSPAPSSGPASRADVVKTFFLCALLLSYNPN